MFGGRQHRRLLSIALLLFASVALSHVCRAASPSGVSAPGAANPADARQLDILEYRVEGNTVLSEDDIDNAVEPFLGPQKHVADIEGAKEALNKAYHDHGYETVSAVIPVQHVTDGVVHLQVIERKVGRLRVTGSQYFDLDVIKRGAPSLAEGSVPDFGKVQSDIVSLNQLPDRAVVPTIKPGRQPNTIDVDLEVHDNPPLHASLELNNRQAPSTTELRTDGSVSYSNLWQRGDVATFRFEVAPERPADALVLAGSYLYHVPGSPISIIGSYLHSNSNVATLGSTTVVGRGDDAGVYATIPLGADGSFVHTADIGIDYKRFYEADTFGGTTTLAPLTWYPISASYTAVWSGAKSTTDLTGGLEFTFGGLGSDTGHFGNKRFDAVPGFVILRGTFDHTETIWHGIEGSAHAVAEVSPQAVIQNEQFSLGGVDTVRGYLEGAALGDYGAALQTEIRSPSLSKLIGEQPNELRAFAFFDMGTAKVHNPLPDQAHSYTLSSAGMGIRARVFDAFSGEVLGAVPFDNLAPTKAGDPRALFRVSGDF